MNFSGKVVFLTGGASGIGLEMAKRFLARGAHLAAFDLRPTDEAARKLLAARQGAHQKAPLYALDVTDAAAVRAAFAKAAAEVGPPVLLFNSAGIVSARVFSELPQEEFERVVRVNLFGSRNAASAALEHLAPGGRLVFMASLAGLIGSYGYTAYASSKFAVVGLAESLRAELKPRGIAVQVVCPPEVETPMVEYERTVRPKATEELKAFAGALSVEEACRGILSGIESGKFLVIPGLRAKLTWLLAKMLPRRLGHLVADYLVARAG